MSWDTTLPIMVRNAIGDTDITPKYSDLQLSPLILTAAQFVLFNIVPTNNYIVDVENETLTPDPTDDPSDVPFMYLVTLKSAIMLLYAEVRRYGQQAIAIRDGTSAIDLKRDLKALTALADAYAKEFSSSIFFYVRNSSELAGRAIMSPYKGLLSHIDDYFITPRICRY